MLETYGRSTPSKPSEDCNLPHPRLVKTAGMSSTYDVQSATAEGSCLSTLARGGESTERSLATACSSRVRAAVGEDGIQIRARYGNGTSNGVPRGHGLRERSDGASGMVVSPGLTRESQGILPDGLASRPVHEVSAGEYLTAGRDSDGSSWHGHVAVALPCWRPGDVFCTPAFRA